MPFDDKVKLTEKVKKLKPADLTQFVNMIRERCPKAVSDLDAKRLQIKVDEIDKETFGKINALLDSRITDDDFGEPPNKKPKVK